jgi:hypothetical protein
MGSKEVEVMSHLVIGSGQAGQAKYLIWHGVLIRPLKWASSELFEAKKAVFRRSLWQEQHEMIPVEDRGTGCQGRR